MAAGSLSSGTSRGEHQDDAGLHCECGRPLRDALDAGRDMRLTDVKGNVVKDVVA